MSKPRKGEKPKITPKQQAFVDEYIVDFNAAAAAVRAGYTTNHKQMAAAQLLGKPHVQEAISAAIQLRSLRTGITADRVLREIARIAFSDLRDVMFWGPNGVVMRDSSEITSDQSAAIAEVSHTVSLSGGSVKVKMHSKTDALEKLCKHLGLYAPERKTLENPDGSGLFQSLTKEHRDAIVAAAKAEN